MHTDRTSRTTITYVLELGMRRRMVIRRGVGVRARRHAILEVCRVRLRYDVYCARGMLVLCCCCRLVVVVVVVVVGFRVERRVLEGREGGVEAAADGLGECAGVFGEGGACGGHDLEIRR